MIMKLLTKENTPDIETILTEFSHKAKRPMELGELEKVKHLYAHHTAQARASNLNQQIFVESKMREVLNEVLLQPSKKVKRGWFDDLRRPK